MERIGHIILVVSMLAIACETFAQRDTKPQKVTPEFYNVQDEIPEGELIHVYLKGENEVLHKVCQNQGWVFKRHTGVYAAVALPKEDVSKLDTISSIEAVHIEIGYGLPLLNESRIHTRIDRVQAGLAGLPHALTGEGVIIGVIDAGLDLEHPDFLDENGNTRVLNLWDQTLPPNETFRIPIYGYGQVYDSADINNGLCPHQDQAVYYGHGTNTTGIASADGEINEDYTGCAPEANIIIVSSSFNSFSWTATVADAVHYIFKRAEEHGRPCVINASIGNYFGSHDGNDLATEEIESLLTDTMGRIMVCAAGNSGEMTPYHLGYEANADTNFTWFRIPSSATSGNGYVQFNIYGDTGDFESVKFSIGAVNAASNYKLEALGSFDSITNFLNSSGTYNLVSNSGNFLAQVTFWGEETNGTYRVYTNISSIDSIDYKYGLYVTGSGRLDVWSSSSGNVGGNTSDIVYDGLPNSNDFPKILDYVSPDYEQQIVGYWACSEKVITVGNFTNRNEYVDVDENTVTYNLTPGEIAASSSSGPSRKGIIKPDVSAPGEVTLTSAASFQIDNQLNNNQRDRVGVGGMHNRAGGTSSASPVVAGMAALFLQHCPYANWNDFQNALHQGAKSDNFAINTPNNQWGYGKADAINMLKYASPSSSLNKTEDDFCSGDSVRLQLLSIPQSFEWNTDQQSQVIFPKQSGIYFATLENEIGCTSFSDTATLFERPIPSKPILEVQGEQPACANDVVTVSVTQEYGAYDWSTGSKTSSIELRAAEEVFCEVLNIYACKNYSDTIDVSFRPHVDDPKLVLQQGDHLKLFWDDVFVNQFRWYKDATIINDANDSIYLANDVGLYKAEIVDVHGCSYSSNEIQLGALSSEHIKPDNGMYIFPNPTNEMLFVYGIKEQYAFKIYRADGVYIKSGELSIDHQNIDLSTLPSGTYYISLTSEIDNSVHQFVKL